MRVQRRRQRDPARLDLHGPAVVVERGRRALRESRAFRWSPRPLTSTASRSSGTSATTRGHVTTQGIRIPLGQSQTIDVALLSGAPVAQHWGVAAYDYDDAILGVTSGSTLRPPSFNGGNGDTFRLTITPTSADSYLERRGLHHLVGLRQPGRSRLREPGDDGAGDELSGPERSREPPAAAGTSRGRHVARRPSSVRGLLVWRRSAAEEGRSRATAAGVTGADRAAPPKVDGAADGRDRRTPDERRRGDGADLRADGDRGRHDVRDRGPLHRRGRDAALGRAVRRGDGARPRRLQPRLRLPGRRLPGEHLRRSQLAPTAASGDRPPRLLVGGRVVRVLEAADEQHRLRVGRRDLAAVRAGAEPDRRHRHRRARAGADLVHAHGRRQQRLRRT